jgi:LysM repeat protein
MKLALQMTAAGCTALLLASCGSTGSTASNNNPSGTGPFDSRGNYIEEWADNPSKWKRGGSSQPGDALVMNDEPPSDSVPIPTAANTPQPGRISSTPVISRPTTVRTSSTATRRTSASTASTKPKAKATVAAKKPAAKKPATARYTIRKGDTLSAIAARNKTSVSALQRANGIKGSLIQPGKVLVIPR